tara:strand:+ start:1231 stop:2853 length:1623 start_codon:yes stop_codon:yes gene_type:complete
MLNFPQESIDKANEIVNLYKKRTNSKLDMAAYLYDGKLVWINYGFDESIKSGNCGKYLHEITKECDCFTRAGVLYLIAKQAGLDPKLYEIHGMKDIEEGENPENMALNNHTFITVSLRKPKPHILDPNMALYGEVTFNKDKNEINVYHKKGNSLTTRKYASLKELSEQEYLEKLEQARSPEGGRKVLSATQRINPFSKWFTFITYLPESHSIQSSLHLDRPLFSPEPYSRNLVIDLVTKVNDNGKYDFNKGTLNFYHVGTAGWNEHERKQLPFSIQTKHQKILWDIWETIAKKSGRKSPVYVLGAFKLEEIIKKAGFKDDFSVQENSLAQKVIQNDFQDQFNLFLNEKNKSINSFLNNFQEDEITQRGLLRDAHYLKQKNENKSNENPPGFLFSDKEHHGLLKQGLQDYKRNLAIVFGKMIIGTAIKAKLKKGSAYFADRLTKPAMNAFEDKAKYFNSLAGSKAFNTDFGFHSQVDKCLFEQTIDIESIPIKELEKGLTKEDLKVALNYRAYCFSISSLVTKPALFINKYKKGLQKILAK